MATIEVDFEFLQELLLPGLKARIERCACVSNPSYDAISIDIAGPDVPDCARARIVMTRTEDPTRPAVVLTAVIKPVED